MKTSRSNEGFALATVLVLILVLTLTIFFSARLTRTDVQVVNNLQNEREAFSTAEAGITEALYRMSVASPSNVTVNGGTFDAAIAPQAGSSWNANVLFSGTSNTLTGTSPNQTLTTPSIQPSTLRLPYSTASAGANSLAINWETVAGSIRTDSAGRKIAKIISTGTSGSATRKITVWAVADGGSSSNPGNARVVTLGTACADGIDVGNGAHATFVVDGTVQINAGPSPSQCPGALSGRNITASDAINIVGGSGASNASPDPTTGALPMDDPLRDLQPPCFPGYTGGARGCQNISPTPTTQCTGTATSPQACSAAGTLNPGIYYGGLAPASGATFNPGVYIVAGGDFRLGSTMSATGVTVFLTNDPSHPTGNGDYGRIDFSHGNGTANLVAPTTGPYAGMILFQDLANTNELYFQGGSKATFTFDGTIYAPNANLHVQGAAGLDVNANLIVKSIDKNGSTDVTVAGPSTPPPFSAPSGIAYSPMAWQDF